MMRTCPACVASVLKSIPAAAEFETFDVLADQDVREGIKKFSAWPTIPQCYIGGEVRGSAASLFPLCMPPLSLSLSARSDTRMDSWLWLFAQFIGGCDLLIEMYQSGELQEMIEKAAAE